MMKMFQPKLRCYVPFQDFENRVAEVDCNRPLKKYSFPATLGELLGLPSSFLKTQRFTN